MKNLTADYYMSNITSSVGEETISQEELNDTGLFLYQADSILKTIGSKECGYNIDIFLNDTYERMTDNSKFRFLKDCFDKLNEVYELSVLEDIVSHFTILEQIEKYVLPLLFFFEKDQCIKLVAELFSFIDMKVMLDFVLFSKFIEINYEIFLEKLKSNNKFPYLIKELFMFTPLNRAILTLWKIISKDRIGINNQQLLKGV